MQLSHALAYAIRGCASDVHTTSPTFIRCLLASYWQQLAATRTGPVLPIEHADFEHSKVVVATPDLSTSCADPA